MIDLLYLAKGRDEFTLESLHELSANTCWPTVRHMYVYADGPAPLEVRAFLDFICAFGDVMLQEQSFGSPVAIMNDFLACDGEEIFAKLDNDVIVPPGWLQSALAVMEANPELDLLGLEPPASRTRSPWARADPIHPEAEATPSDLERGYVPCDAIGGIGLMRRRAFCGREPMRPHSTYGGFTDWQLRQPEVKKGWLVPPLKLFLLDRLTVDPWASLSKRYIAEGLQRPWTPYPDSAKDDLWGWWNP